MHFVWKLGLLLLTVKLLAATAVAQTDRPLTLAPGERAVGPTDKPYGVVLQAAIWPSTQIPVCLENQSALSQKELEWIRDAIRKSWEAHSKLKFSGWQACASDNKGIRIKVDDSGPHTKGLGTQLNGKKDGMVLNVRFQNWSQSCAASEAKRESCIRSIAVHEFGHAIGFAHEQNRADTPGECTSKPQGTSGDRVLTPWDSASVMNYCNPVYNNDGVLSAGDIQAVQMIYGKP